jgi:hypothetical protein
MAGFGQCRPRLNKAFDIVRLLQSPAELSLSRERSQYAILPVFTLVLHFTMRLAGSAWLRAIGSNIEDACLYRPKLRSEEFLMATRRYNTANQNYRSHIDPWLQETSLSLQVAAR